MTKFILLSITLLGLAGCCNESLVDDSNIPNNDGVLEKISIKGADFLYEENTRSFVSISENGASFSWDEDDVVGIFPNKGDQVSFAMEEGVGTGTATFSGGGWALKSSATYSAYYPHVYENRDMTKIPVSYLGQTQDGNNNTDHIGAYDFMATNVTTPSNGAVAFDMQHLGCLVQVMVDLKESTAITNLNINSANFYGFTTEGYIDLSSKTPAILSSAKSNAINIALESFCVDADETAVIYFMMAPANLEGKNIDIAISKDNGENKTYQVAGKNYVAGKAYAIALADIEDATLTYNMVDLGLPSGTLWADRNVGAEFPESYGDYFAWGETLVKDSYNWSTYKWCNKSSDNLTKYCTKSSYGSIDNKTVLDLDDDAAYVNWGKEWRMPTHDELKELYSKCTWNWTNQNGTNGYKVTGPSGNSIFLPAAGNRFGHYSLDEAGSTASYWTSSLHEDYPFCAWNLDNYNVDHDFNRCTGLPVRAVARRDY